MMKVTFCGHKELADRMAVKQWLQSVCRELILQGADEFYLGGYGAFDRCVYPFCVSLSLRIVIFDSSWYFPI